MLHLYGIILWDVYATSTLLVCSCCCCRDVFALPNQSNASGIFRGSLKFSMTWQSVVFTAILQKTFPDALRLLFFEENMSKVTIATPQNTKKIMRALVSKNQHHIHHDACNLFSVHVLYQRIFRQGTVENMDLKHLQKANWIQWIKNLLFTFYYLYDQNMFYNVFFYFHADDHTSENQRKRDPKNHGLKVQNLLTFLGLHFSTASR